MTCRWRGWGACRSFIRADRAAGALTGVCLWGPSAGEGTGGPRMLLRRRARRAAHGGPVPTRGILMRARRRCGRHRCLGKGEPDAPGEPDRVEGGPYFHVVGEINVDVAGLDRRLHGRGDARG